MKGRDVDNVTEDAARRSQNRAQIVEGQPDLRSKVWLGAAILAAADLFGNEQQIARPDRGRAPVLSVQVLPSFGKDRGWSCYDRDSSCYEATRSGAPRFQCVRRDSQPVSSAAPAVSSARAYRPASQRSAAGLMPAVASSLA